ncbi:hypothetical protein [Sporomusa malonica]|uniref:Uncharacterized protein n=1 Tax=Sporomusa malonica TaxID=112901 RepID=A0A1W1YM94_9FIRM|nr:hypothetical protein [Sporomusa malonica]SMC37307.1 hypothetical protein SAMN04488500_1022 [Sporomusa malonica]
MTEIIAKKINCPTESCGFYHMTIIKTLGDAMFLTQQSLLLLFIFARYLTILVAYMALLSWYGFVDEMEGF